MLAMNPEEGERPLLETSTKQRLLCCLLFTQVLHCKRFTCDNTQKFPSGGCFYRLATNPEEGERPLLEAATKQRLLYGSCLHSCYLAMGLHITLRRKLFK
jgi:hypothetical protein